ncbi:Peptidase M23 [Rippkaea orientalis PCC 8801]|uniref:Peptidase M23 n=1 Tax=Rippkaea orientalis (strain PCC 8801 / RF-1) TaxID=41431 RepID=B7K140_RIPO1|nr:peptidoglycan DD-metalloendopeptidase family protein [Rippkaea orientalis]ACK66235.1 Peptidase M23 [Rippkaea orientalis PCC 8801]
MSSCLADTANASVIPLTEDSPSNIAPNDSTCRVRRSAAMIGLAISMSATGLLLTQNKAAVAANSLAENVNLSSLPAPSYPQLAKADTVESEDGKLAPVSLKHKVKAGESIEELGRIYQVDSKAIASINNLPLQAPLVPGQTLKIPSVSKLDSGSQAPQVKIETSKSQELASKPLNTSLDHLRETRKRLQESLVELKTEKSKAEVTPLVADVSDVSQPLNAQETPSSVNQEGQGISIPVIQPENNSVSRQISPSSSTLTSTEGETPTIKPASKVPSLAKLPSVPQAKIEESELPQFNEPIAIPVLPAENNSEVPSVSSPRRLSTLPQPREVAPQTTPPTHQARIVPQPSFNEPVSNRFYRVRPGDTLNSIARSHGLTLSELIRANGITNPNLIKVHQNLIIPQKGLSARSQLQPRNLANLPQSGNLVASSPDGLSPSALPVPLSPLPSRATTETNEFQKRYSGQKQSEPIEIEVTSAFDSHTDKLKADIANLEQEYADNSESDAIEIQTELENERTKPIVGQTLNNEWARDRQGRTFSDRQKQPGDRRIAQRLPNSRLVGVAPSDTEQYNDAFRIPVGTNVGPELPPLSGPDNYLPGAPTQFTGYIWPTKGVLTSGYGRRWGRMHKGIDIAAPIGTPIIAAAPGEVITSGWNSGGYGKLVKVRHPDGSVTLYAHNSRLLVRRGQQVEQGQQIAEMGSTGYSTGPHLHFEVHPNGRGAVNPIAMLPRKN